MKFEVTFEIEKDDNLIVLTTEEARDLYNKLKQHFGEDTLPPAAPIITYPVYPTYPTYPTEPQFPYTPWSYPNTGSPIPPKPWTYGNTTNPDVTSK